MYTEGEWSDLKIVTSTRTFDVHKVVVCAASPFLKAACQNDWQEAKTGIISLPENETVIDGVLRYCYGYTSAIDYDPKPPFFADIINILEILIAADKVNRIRCLDFGRIPLTLRQYQLLELKERTAHEVVGEIEGLKWLGDGVPSVDVGIWAYDEGRRNVLGGLIIRKIVSSIACRISGVLSHQETWFKLQDHEELLQDVVRCVARNSSTVYNKGSLRDPEYMQF